MQPTTPNPKSKATMNILTKIRQAATFAVLAALPAQPAIAWDTLRSHPQNPYLVQFRGQPRVLRSFGQHYDIVVNSGMDYLPYLNVLQRDGMNLTRAFLLGFIDDTPSAALFTQPWPRTTTNGTALDGLGKWDLSQWNEAYFTRLNAFAQACSDRGIAAEVSLFCTFYNATQWRASPCTPANNVQGYGPISQYDSLRPVDANLLAVQQAAVRRIVSELNRFDNIYYELQNEPFWNEPGIKDNQEVDFHNRILATIRTAESALPNRHLVAHNFPQQSAALSSDFDLINEHYPTAVKSTTIAGADALLRDQYFRGKILSLDETDNTNTAQARLESWMFFSGGGGIYDGLDSHQTVYTAIDPNPARSVDVPARRRCYLRWPRSSSGLYRDGSLRRQRHRHSVPHHRPQQCQLCRKPQPGGHAPRPVLDHPRHPGRCLLAGHVKPRPTIRGILASRPKRWRVPTLLRSDRWFELPRLTGRQSASRHLACSLDPAR